MSGAFCPYCSDGNFKKADGKDQCQMCGWKGKLDEQFRSWLTEEVTESLAKDRALKKAGKLVYLRIYHEAGADIQFNIIDVLKVNGCGNAPSDGKDCVIARMDKKPTSAMLAKLKKMKGVEKVEVW